MTLTMTPDVNAENAAAYAMIHNVVVSEHDLPGFLPMTAEGALRAAQNPWVSRDTDTFIAWLDGQAVARLELSMPLKENLSNVYIMLDVLPAYRRRGIGRQLLDLAIEQAKAHGRSKLFAQTTWELPNIPVYDGGAGVAFAEATGFENANLPEVMRRLELSTVDEEALETLHSKAKERASGYAVRQWIDYAPDELINDVAYLDGRLSTDAPMGDLGLEPDLVDAERIRSAEQVNVKRGRKSFHSGIVHEASGRLVAWTTISHDKDIPWHAWQQITIVDPDHRGHRLGALVKVENLRFFRAQVLSVEKIDTFNAAENSYMIAINEDMGFRPKFAFANWKREI